MGSLGSLFRLQELKREMLPFNFLILFYMSISCVWSFRVKYGLLKPFVVTEVMSSKLYGTLTRFDTVPVPLYCYRNGPGIRLRSYEENEELRKKGYYSYDLHEKNGKVFPTEGDVYTGSNGMRLLSQCEDLKNMLLDGDDDHLLYVLRAGLKMTSKLVLVQEDTFKYSVQVREPMTLADFNEELNYLIENQDLISRVKLLSLMGVDEND